MRRTVRNRRSTPKTMATRKKKARPEPPDTVDPMSEPSITRRIWAAYLERGFTRAAFSRAVNIRYATIDSWDRGDAVPDLENLMTVSQVLGYSMDELCYGRPRGKQRRQATAPTPTRMPLAATMPDANHELSEAEIRALFSALGATVDERTAYARHVKTDRARFGPATFTAGYVSQWLDTLRSTGDYNLAAIYAERAVALAGAVAHGGKPIPAEALRALDDEADDDVDTER